MFRTGTELFTAILLVVAVVHYSTRYVFADYSDSQLNVQQPVILKTKAHYSVVGKIPCSFLPLISQYIRHHGNNKNKTMVNVVKPPRFGYFLANIIHQTVAICSTCMFIANSSS